jgi:hypothetical protein
MKGGLNGHGQSGKEVDEIGSNGEDKSAGISESGHGPENCAEVFDIGQITESGYARAYVEDEAGSI